MVMKHEVFVNESQNLRKNLSYPQLVRAEMLSAETQPRTQCKGCFKCQLL